MINKRNVIAVFVIAITVGLIIQKEYQFVQSAQIRVTDQANSLGISLWKFDVEATSARVNYLSKLNNYKSFKVVDYTGQEFCKSKPLNLSKIDSTFIKVGLVRVFPISSDIIYKDQIIGKVFVEKYNFLIYKYLYLILVSVLVLIVVFSFDKLSRNNVLLEKLVDEKTEMIRKSEERLRIILNSISEGVLAIDDDRNILHINPAAIKILGLSEDIEKEKSFNTLLHKIDMVGDSRDKFNSKNLHQMNSGGTSTEKVLIDEDERTISIATAPILVNSTSIGFVFVFSDITERLREEEDKHQSQKLESIGQLAGGIAHDFNNMLGAILGATELLEMDYNEGKVVDKDFVDIIKMAASGAADLTRKLLSFSRKETIDMKIVDIHEVLESTYTMLSHTISKKIKIKIDLQAKDFLVFGDASTLQNIFLNMGINSSHAMENGGSLIFSSDNIVLDHNDNDLHILAGEYIQIKVIDTGCGIEKENIKKIFDPFFTTKEQGKGTGLGLSAVYGGIKQLGGGIYVDSIVGKGTTFTIYLPIYKGELDDSNDKDVVINKNKGTILLVDDELVNRKMARLILEKIGFSVETATDGQDAINIYKKKTNAFDYIILDMVMPNMDGEEALKIIKGINPQQKVIIVSGYTKHRNGRDTTFELADGFLEKPYKIKDLQELLSNI